MSTSSPESEEESLFMQLASQLSIVQLSINNFSVSSSLPNEARPSTSFNMVLTAEANLSSGETGSFNPMESSQMPDMKKEINRLKSYRHWPVAFMNPHRLAAAGFYYVGGDIVKCAFCGIHMDNLEEGYDPFTEHQNRSLNCGFLRGFPVGNVPISPNSANETVATGEPNNNSDALTILEIRPISILEREPVRAMRAAIKKIQGIYESSGPLHPEYNTDEARLQSYKSWPCSLKFKPEQFAEAGFFYVGIKDYVKCFYCGGVLKEWKVNDDPWVEHAKWYSECTYVQLLKGHEFIEEANRKKIALILAIGQPAEPSTAPKEASTSHSIASVEQIESNNSSSASSNAITVSDDARFCLICFANQRGILFIPCGHIVSCVECALSLSKCPVCHCHFTAIVKAFLS